MNVVVVGASGRLGRTVCGELARRGARVGGTFCTNEASAAELGRTIDGFLARRLDLANATEIERTIADLASAIGGVDALVHCAAIASAAKSPTYDRHADVDPEVLAHLLAVNVAGPLLVARAFAAVASARNLVLVGSIDGAKPVPTATPYATTKGALVAMARALAKELGPRMLVNVVARAARS